MQRDHLIRSSGQLLSKDGRLREPGYALRPPFIYNREDIAAPGFRIKDWDYYLANDDSYAVALTFADLGYMGLISASVMDFGAGSFKTTTELVPVPMGRMGVPRGSDTGNINWENGRCRVHFWHPAHGTRRLSFFMARFDGLDDLEVELFCDQEPRDSMVIATPWAEDPRSFYYNRKIIGMRCQGGFRRGEKFHEFAAADALCLLDWGRGVWTYENTWYWAAAQGHQDGHVIGFNLGYGFGDTSAASENMFFLDGRAHKLHLVDFGIPRLPDGGYDYLAPWHMTDDEGRLDLVFTPQIDRQDNTDVAGVIVSLQHQVFGKLDGRVTLDDGQVFEVRGLRGSAEHIFNKY